MCLEIKRIDNEFEECAEVIRAAFITVADEFNITKLNAPTNPAYLEAVSLEKMKKKGIEMYGAYEGDQCVGFVAIEKAGEDNYYMEKLAVLPEFRHNGYGKELINFVVDSIKMRSGQKIGIAIINKNLILKKWYIKNGFIETGTKVFEHLPFEVCFMERTLT
jgi:diamine N-acetyltransferase